MPGPGRGEVTLGQALLVGCDLCKQSLAPQLCVATIPWVTVRQCITATTWNITRGDLNFRHYLSLGDNTTCYIAKFTFTFLQLSMFSVSVMVQPYAHCKLVKTFMLCLFSVGFLEWGLNTKLQLDHCTCSWLPCQAMSQDKCRGGELCCHNKDHPAHGGR